MCLTVNQDDAGSIPALTANLGFMKRFRVLILFTVVLVLSTACGQSGQSQAPVPPKLPVPWFIKPPVKSPVPHIWADDNCMSYSQTTYDADGSIISTKRIFPTLNETEQPHAYRRCDKAT